MEALAVFHETSTLNHLWSPKSEKRQPTGREKMNAGGREDGRATPSAPVVESVTPNWPTLTTASPAAVRDAQSHPRRIPSLLFWMKVHLPEDPPSPEEDAVV